MGKEKNKKSVRLVSKKINVVPHVDNYLMEKKTSFLNKKWIKWGVLIFVIILILIVLCLVFPQYGNHISEPVLKNKEERVMSTSKQVAKNKSQHKESKKEGITAELLEKNTKALLVAGMLYGKKVKPGQYGIWNSDFEKQDTIQKMKRTSNFTKGGTYLYCFKNDAIKASAEWPMFSPSDDGKHLYFYIAYGIPRVDSKGKVLDENFNPQIEVSAERLVQFIHDYHKEKTFNNLLKRVTMENVSYRKQVQLTTHEVYTNESLLQAVLVLYGKNNISSEEWQNVENISKGIRQIEAPYNTASGDKVSSGTKYEFETSVPKEGDMDIVGVPTVIVDADRAYYGTITMIPYVEDDVLIEDIIQYINDNDLADDAKAIATQF